MRIYAQGKFDSMLDSVIHIDDIGAILYRVDGVYTRADVEVEDEEDEACHEDGDVRQSYRHGVCVCDDSRGSEVERSCCEEFQSRSFYPIYRYATVCRVNYSLLVDLFRTLDAGTAEDSTHITA